MESVEGEYDQTTRVVPDEGELDPTKPLVLLLGSIDHEGIVSRLRTAGHQYKKKMLDSSVENWRSILRCFDEFAVRAVVIKLTGWTYELLGKEEYSSVANQLLTRIAPLPNAAFAFESLLSGQESGDGAEIFHQPSAEVVARVNALLKDMKLNVVPYQRNAEVTMLAGEFLIDTDQGLLFRVYVPSGRLWANEVDRLLGLFRDYLTRVGKGDVRLEQFRTQQGTAYEFHGDLDSKGQPLSKQFAEFSHLLDLCLSNPHAAEQLLKEKDVRQREIVDILTRYTKEAKRLHIDLKQDRERKLLSIRHRLESELADVIVEPNNWHVIDALVEKLVPANAGAASAYLIDQSRLPLPSSFGSASITINLSQQLIESVNGIAIGEIRGDLHLSEDDQKLLNLVQTHGGEKSAELASAVHELSDKAIPQEKRLKAAQRLKGFLYAIGSHADKIATALLQKYIEHQLGL